MQDADQKGDGTRGERGNRPGPAGRLQLQQFRAVVQQREQFQLLQPVLLVRLQQQQFVGAVLLVRVEQQQQAVEFKFQQLVGAVLLVRVEQQQQAVGVE